MLTLLHKRLDEQERKAIHEREKVALERYAVTVSTTSFLFRSKSSKGLRQGALMWRNLILHHYVRRILPTQGTIGGVVDLYPHVARNTPMRVSLLSPLRRLASRISWRWSEGFMKARRNLAVTQDPPSCGSPILLFRRRSHPTGSRKSS